MPDKLTDAEVKKALECCSTYYDVSSCKNCPLDGKCEPNMLEQYAFDLINRYEEKNSNLQEKNSNLTSDLTSLQKDLTSAKAEIEKLNKIILKGNFSSITASRAREHWFRQNTEHINRLNAEVEKLKAENKLLSRYEDYIKAEAYKEFADNIERAFSKVESQISQIPNVKLVEKTIQICRNVIRIVLNELVSNGDAHE